MRGELGTDPQIRSKQRVRDLAEVYTHRREVDAMLDLVSDMFPSPGDPSNIDRTFLEPACGSGNFLVAILERKLAFITLEVLGGEEILEHRLLRCLASTYGIDINEDNVQESRDRLWSELVRHTERWFVDSPSPAFDAAASAILATNVICADTLGEATEIVFVNYTPGASGTFTREWVKPLDPDFGELSLFGLASVRDKRPVHYTELADHPGPVATSPPKRQAA